MKTLLVRYITGAEQNPLTMAEASGFKATSRHSPEKGWVPLGRK